MEPKNKDTFLSLENFGYHLGKYEERQVFISVEDAASGASKIGGAIHYDAKVKKPGLLQGFVNTIANFFGHITDNQIEGITIKSSVYLPIYNNKEKKNEVHHLDEIIQHLSYLDEGYLKIVEKNLYVYRKENWYEVKDKDFKKIIYIIKYKKKRWDELPEALLLETAIKKGDVMALSHRLNQDEKNGVPFNKSRYYRASTMVATMVQDKVTKFTFANE